MTESTSPSICDVLATSTALVAPKCKSDEYRVAADPQRYRTPDAPLFSCRTHGAAAVLCTTAGKTGRNGTTATVGATLFWLTCPFLNNLIARLERHGAVQSVRDFFVSYPYVAQAHMASHDIFVHRAEAVLEPSHWDFFRTHFVDPVDSSARKHGNAAVADPVDIKCLHALVAQYLAGADNIIGRVTVQYIMHLHALLPLLEADEDGDAKSDATELTGAKRRTRADDANAADSAIKTQMDDIANFRAFLEAHVTPDAPASMTLSELEIMSPDICEQARCVVVFLEGRAPRTRKKHRRN